MSRDVDRFDLGVAWVLWQALLAWLTLNQSVNMPRNQHRHALANTNFGVEIADRFGAARLLPFYLLPMGAAMTVMGFADQFWMASVALVAIGVTQGASQAMIGPIWPEYFGTRNLGSIRAFAVAASVFSTAIGPGTRRCAADPDRCGGRGRRAATRSSAHGR